MPRKAQTEVITLVLISGIVISLVGVAYMWGIPLISKRTSITDFLSAEDFVVKLNDRIVQIANSGSGEASLDIPKGMVRIIPFDSSNPRNPGNNSILYETLVSQPLAMGSSVVIKTNVLGENATYGEAEPRVINLTSQVSGTENKLIFSMHYRELDTRSEPFRGYLIGLQIGSGSLTGGTNRVTVSYAGTQTMPGGAANGGDLIVTMIRVDLV